jgi:hypothetical protein
MLNSFFVNLSAALGASFILDLQSAAIGLAADERLNGHTTDYVI